MNESFVFFCISEIIPSTLFPYTNGSTRTTEFPGIYAKFGSVTDTIKTLLDV